MQLSRIHRRRFHPKYQISSCKFWGLDTKCTNENKLSFPLEWESRTIRIWFQICFSNEKGCHHLIKRDSIKGHNFFSLSAELLWNLRRWDFGSKPSFYCFLGSFLVTRVLTGLRANHFLAFLFPVMAVTISYLNKSPISKPSTFQNSGLIATERLKLKWWIKP